jgi:hypothetical protein
VSVVLRPGALAAVSLCLVAEAHAAVLPIHGDFGNEAGCLFLQRGETGEGLAALTGYSVWTSETKCDFVVLRSASKGVYTVASMCSGAGSDPGMDDVVVTRRAEGDYVATIDGGEPVGPMLECPGVGT